MLRSSIVLDAGRALARGATIATRYCAIRRQFSDKDESRQAEELQVLSYPMVQNRVLPLIATAFAMHLTGTAMMALYQRVAATFPDENGNESDQTKSKQLLAELHSTSCGLKALSTTAAAEGLEVARRACGGHGYSSFSGIGPWYADYVPTTTWDGDNFMLTQQVAKHVSDSLSADLVCIAERIYSLWMWLVLHSRASRHITTQGLICTILFPTATRYASGTYRRTKIL